MDKIEMDKKISLQDTVSTLGVSSATVRNWIRHNYLTPEKNGSGLLFNQKEIEGLKEKIANGEINRLNKRANKKGSKNTFIPDEYAGNEKIIFLVQDIVKFFAPEANNQKQILYGMVLNLLRKKGLVSFENHIRNFDDIYIKTEFVKNELNSWRQLISNNFDFYNYSDLLNVELPEISDILGLVYQSIVAEGNKAESGSYYTPKEIVDEIASEYIEHSSVILDPCCGTGQFLLSASDIIKNPLNLWGFDTDEIAVALARINLLAKFPEKKFVPNIYRKNTLLNFCNNNLFSEDIPRFDVIMTNPPWGFHFSNSETEQLQQLFPDIKSNEAFSYFLNKGIDLLKENGRLSFILPEAILKVKVHRDIREKILAKTKILKIKNLERLFKNVFTPVIRLDVIKSTPDHLYEFKAEAKGQEHFVKQSRLKENPDFLFDVFNNGNDISIFEKIFNSEHITLKENADWALGIVSGDNRKFISENKLPQNEPILTGKDVKRFIANSPKNFIQFNPEKFQQVAPENKYRAKEKLIYKFISRELVFSYDNKQMLTLNSANILIPKLKNYPIKTILALFNSSLYQFIFQKKFGSLKVLRGDLEKLPLPLISEQQHKQIIKSVDTLISREINEQKRISEYEKIDDLIMDIFSMNDEQKNYVLSNIKVSKKSLKIE